MKKNSCASLLALIAFLLLSSSCDSIRTRRMSKCVVTFPDSLEFVHDGMSGIRHWEKVAPTYRQVILVDSLECSFCRVQKTRRYKDLFDESIDDGKFDLVVILTPKKEDVETLREFLLAHDFDLPYYLDPEGEFMSLNPCIPKDARFHIFLLDPSGVPVYVGDPLKGNKAYKQFESIISR